MNLNRFVSKVAVVFLCLYLVGCAPTKYNLLSHTEVSKSSGVIVASVTASNGGAISYSYRRKGDDQEFRLAANAAGPEDYLRDRKKRGQLVAVDLEPGEYELTNWSMFVYGYPSSVTYTPKNPQPISFTVQPGVVTYLGNLHTDVMQGKNIFRITIPVGAKPNFGDDSGIDLDRLPAKYPHLASWPVRKSILAETVSHAHADL